MGFDAGELESANVYVKLRNNLPLTHIQLLDGVNVTCRVVIAVIRV